MPLPEQGTQEWAFTEQRIHRRIMDTASNVAVRRKDLPPVIHIVIHDDMTGEKFGAYAGVEYIGESGMAEITRTSIGMIRPGSSIQNVANGLLERHEGVPLICDRKTADELAKGSITWVAEDHYRLEGLSHGVLEVYTPYQADQISKDILPSGVASAQFYRE